MPLPNQPCPPDSLPVRSALTGRPAAPLLAAGVIVLAAAAAYFNSFSGPFVFLDVPAIADNPTIRHLWPIGPVLSPPADGGLTVGGRPVVNLSLAINYALGGTSVWGYHAFNLAVHILAGLTLFGIVRRTVGRAARSERSLLLAFVVALLWTVHPLQTESVTYIVQRAESLMGLFYLLTLYCFVRAAEGQGRAGLWLGLSLAACLLGMGTKEVMVSAPVIVFLYDRTFLSGTFREAWRRRRRYYLGLASTWFLLGALVISTGARGGTAGFGLGFSWWGYVLTQFGAIVHYLRLALWPHPLDFDYTARWVRRPLEVVPAAAVVAALVVATAYAFLRSVRRDARPPLAVQQNGGEGQFFGMRALGFAGVWFFAILAPTSLVPGLTQTIAEHRMYLALAPTMAVVIWGADAALQAFRTAAWQRSAASAYVVPATALVVALAFAGLTGFRNHEYRSALALWGDTAQKSPDNPYAQNNFGIALIDAGRLAEATACFEQAVRLKPDYAEAYNNLGLAVAGLGRLSEAIADYERAMRLKPNYPEAHANLGVALASTGRNDEAILHFQEALRLNPDYADARNNFAVALAGAGRLKEAITQYEAVLRTGSAHAETYYNLGNALAMTGRMPEAIARYEAAVRLKPDYVEAQANLGAVLAQTGRPTEAITHYQEALRLDPKDADVHYNLGLALRSVGRLREAQTQFEEAARLNVGH